MTHYLSGEEDPKEIAKFEAEQKAKREKKAKERQESIERSQEAADERRHIGSTAGWGRLKSEVGWISLDYIVRV